MVAIPIRRSESVRNIWQRHILHGRRSLTRTIRLFSLTEEFMPTISKSLHGIGVIEGLLSP